QVYADKNKVKGVEYSASVVPELFSRAPSSLANPGSPTKAFGDDKEEIYQQYLQAFKKGVYNYIKEEADPITQETTPRKYFSGGFDLAMSTTKVLEIINDKSMLGQTTGRLLKGLSTAGLAVVFVALNSMSNYYQKPNKISPLVQTIKINKDNVRQKKNSLAEVLDDNEDNAPQKKRPLAEIVDNDQLEKGQLDRKIKKLLADLVHNYKASDVRERIKIRDDLLWIGRPIIPFLKEIIIAGKGQDKFLYKEALEIISTSLSDYRFLSDEEYKQNLPYLIKALDDDDPEVRLLATRILIRMGPLARSVVQDIIKSLAHDQDVHSFSGKLYALYETGYYFTYQDFFKLYLGFDQYKRDEFRTSYVYCLKRKMGEHASRIKESLTNDDLRILLYLYVPTENNGRKDSWSKDIEEIFSLQNNFYYGYYFVAAHPFQAALWAFAALVLLPFIGYSFGKNLSHRLSQSKKMNNGVPGSAFYHSVEDTLRLANPSGHFLHWIQVIGFPSILTGELIVSFFNPAWNLPLFTVAGSIIAVNLYVNWLYKGIVTKINGLAVLEKGSLNRRLDSLDGFSLEELYLMSRGSVEKRIQNMSVENRQEIERSLRLLKDSLKSDPVNEEIKQGVERLLVFLEGLKPKDSAQAVADRAMAEGPIGTNRRVFLTRSSLLAAALIDPFRNARADDKATEGIKKILKTKINDEKLLMQVSRYLENFNPDIQLTLAGEFNEDMWSGLLNSGGVLDRRKWKSNLDWNDIKEKLEKSELINAKVSNDDTLILKLNITRDQLIKTKRFSRLEVDEILPLLNEANSQNDSFADTLKSLINGTADLKQNIITLFWKNITYREFELKDFIDGFRLATKGENVKVYEYTLLKYKVRFLNNLTKLEIPWEFFGELKEKIIDEIKKLSPKKQVHFLLCMRMMRNERRNLDIDENYEATQLLFDLMSEDEAVTFLSEPSKREGLLTASRVEKVFLNMGSVAIQKYFKVEIEKMKTSREIILKNFFKVFNEQQPMSTSTFNMYVYWVATNNSSLEQVREYTKGLYNSIQKDPGYEQRNRYMMALSFFLKKDIGLKKREYLETTEGGVVKAIDSYSTPALKPPFYDSMVKTKELNIQMYNPLSPYITESVFLRNGYNKSPKEEGKLTVFTKEENGIKVNVKIDETGDPSDYGGSIFESMKDSKVHMIVYSGHTGYGFNLKKSLELAPPIDTLESGNKFVLILSCCSIQVYLRDIKLHYPFLHVGGTITDSYVRNDTDALINYIKGFTELKSYEDTQRSVNEWEKSVNRGLVNFVGPHETGEFSIYMSQEGRPYLKNETVAKPILQDRFDYVPGNIRSIDRREEKERLEIVVKKRVDYFMQHNDFLMKYKGLLEAGGFQIFYEGEQESRNPIKITESESGKSHQISFNIGYVHSSEPVLSMMALYEANLYFSKVDKIKKGKEGNVTVVDQLRGLQMVALYAKKFHKEDLFQLFLKKYKMENTKTKDLFQTFDSNPVPERVKALQEILRSLDYKGIDSQEFLDENGLLSFLPSNSTPRNFIAQLVTGRKQNTILKYFDDIVTRISDDSAQLVSKKDQAMLEERGGIDLTSDKALQVKNDGNGEIKFHLDPAQLAQLQNTPGFTPVIINIQPMADLRVFLGLTQEFNEKLASA
ncbi:MAG: HEAT repeat domain-containing protein, partial [Candidatus Omnitrophica bacterium]|nr:HEAT repeat domain-containing protein [Candidatus Omnitrophota bacterium]